MLGAIQYRNTLGTQGLGEFTANASRARRMCSSRVLADSALSYALNIC